MAFGGDRPAFEGKEGKKRECSLMKLDEEQRAVNVSPHVVRKGKSGLLITGLKGRYNAGENRRPKETQGKSSPATESPVRSTGKQ